MTVNVSQATLSVMVIPDSSLNTVQVSQCFIEVLADAPPPGRLHLSAVKLSHAIYDDADVIIDRNDRSAYDMHLNEDLHASDIEQDELTRHLPIPAGADYIPIWNGTNWEALLLTFLRLTDVPDSYVDQADKILVVNQAETGLVFEDKPDPYDVMVIEVSGTLSTESQNLRYYNNFQSHRSIQRVFIAVNTAPTGDSIIVDVDNNGSSIFGSGNEPEILATEFTGESENFQDNIWQIGSYLQIDVAQVGSTIAGADLTVHIIHQPTQYLPWIEMTAGLLDLVGNPITVIGTSVQVAIDPGALTLTENALSVVAQNSVVQVAAGVLNLSGSVDEVHNGVSYLSPGGLNLTGNAITVVIGS